MGSRARSTRARAREVDGKDAIAVRRARNAEYVRRHRAANPDRVDYEPGELAIEALKAGRARFHGYSKQQVIDELLVAGAVALGLIV